MFGFLHAQDNRLDITTNAHSVSWLIGRVSFFFIMIPAEIVQEMTGVGKITSESYHSF